MGILPPAADEFEISLFGTGYGESLIIHYANNKWIVIDSCYDYKNKNSAVLSYFNQLDISPDITHIIVSHWHDDHIKGISQILDSFPNSNFICSAAIYCKEFLNLVSIYSNHSHMVESGTTEFNNIIHTLKHRGVSPAWAIVNRILVDQSEKIGDNEVSIKLIALSPSDKSVLNSHLALGKLIPETGEMRKRIQEPSKNHSSIVLHLSINDNIILLGSDLENISDKECGWEKVYNSQTRPNAKATIFKIPHHGSQNGYHERVWTDMLVQGPFCILTPFYKLKEPLPRENEIKLFNKHSEEIYITNNVRKKNRIKRDPTVDKTIRSTVKAIQKISNNPGQVRLRKKITESNWNVNLFGEAGRLKTSM